MRASAPPVVHDVLGVSAVAVAAESRRMSRSLRARAAAVAARRRMKASVEAAAAESRQPGPGRSCRQPPGSTRQRRAASGGAAATPADRGCHRESGTDAVIRYAGLQIMFWSQVRGRSGPQHAHGTVGMVHNRLMRAGARPAHALRTGRRVEVADGAVRRKECPLYPRSVDAQRVARV